MSGEAETGTGNETETETEASLDGTKLAAARLWATNRYPYLASAVFAVPTVPAPDLGRLIVDRWWRIHADPAVVTESTVAELGGEILHLTCHLLRDHAGRADKQHFSEEAELHHWVDAADAEIADDFPPDVDRVSESVRPDDLDCGDGRLAEEYYRRGSVRSDAKADCGSGAHGDSPDWEPPPPTARSSQGVGADEQQLIRRSVAAEVARAESDAVSASLREWASDQIRPRIDWRSELAASLRKALGSVSGAVDYSYRRPSRRAQASTGVVLASLEQPTVEVAVVCDTSASVSDELLGIAMGEVDGILRATGVRSVNVFACDDAVRTVSRVTSGRHVALIGGGGTDMAIGIDAAMNSRPRPQLLVVLTDGYTPWPNTAQKATVIVGLLNADANTDGLAPAPIEPPTWARTIAIAG